MSLSINIQNHKSEQGGCCDMFGNQRKQKADLAPDDADLAKEMMGLSFEEREKALEDVHGVSSVKEEAPDFIQINIDELEAAILEIPSRDRKAYNKAMFLKPAFQYDRKLKLQFLRAEEYNPRKAAQRLVKFFGQKLDLFGEEKLVKRLTLDDLEEAELNLFNIGYMTILPRRDRSGRPIVFGDGTKLNFDIMTIDNIVRCFFFMMCCYFEDELGQKKGACIVMRFSGQRRSISKSTELASKSAYSTHCFPGRITSYHVCYDDPKMHFIFSTVRWTISGPARQRTRTHFGSEVENDYNLLTFGIPSEGLLQKAKNGTHTIFDEFLQKRRESDEAEIAAEAREEASSGIIVYPKPKDILIGRGHPFRDLPCNAIWDKAIQDNAERHRDSSQFEKTCISIDIVKRIVNGGSRFLERTDDGWKELSEEAARKKTASAFRNRARNPNAGARGAKHAAPPFGDEVASDPAAKRPRFDPSMQQRQHQAGLFLRW